MTKTCFCYPLHQSPRFDMATLKALPSWGTVSPRTKASCARGIEKNLRLQTCRSPDLPQLLAMTRRSPSQHTSRCYLVPYLVTSSNSNGAWLTAKDWTSDALNPKKKTCKGSLWYLKEVSPLLLTRIASGGCRVCSCFAELCNGKFSELQGCFLRQFGSCSLSP